MELSLYDFDVPGNYKTICLSMGYNRYSKEK